MNVDSAVVVRVHHRAPRGGRPWASPRRADPRPRPGPRRTGRPGSGSPPSGTRDGGVVVREEGGVAASVDRRLAAGREAGEEPLEQSRASSGSCPGAAGAGRTTRPTRSASSKLRRCSASQSAPAGVASWVRKAITSPSFGPRRGCGCARGRTPPAGSRSRVAPAARAISSERSRDPESITSSSTSRLTSWASTAASTSSR